jgi:hypothetical protein
LDQTEEKVFGADFPLMKAFGFLVGQAEHPAGSLGEPFQAVCHKNLPFRLLDRPKPICSFYQILSCKCLLKSGLFIGFSASFFTNNRVKPTIAIRRNPPGTAVPGGFQESAESRPIIGQEYRLNSRIPQAHLVLSPRMGMLFNRQVIIRRPIGRIAAIIFL